MNKTELVTQVNKIFKNKEKALTVIDCLIDSMSNALKKEESITLSGFGTFKVVKRKSRMGRNPKTGEEMQIEARNTVKFVMAKALKETLN